MASLTTKLKEQLKFKIMENLTTKQLLSQIVAENLQNGYETAIFIPKIKEVYKYGSLVEDHILNDFKGFKIVIWNNENIDNELINWNRLN